MSGAARADASARLLVRSAGGALALALGIGLLAPPGGPVGAAAARADEEPKVFLDDQESFSIADPPCELARPDKDWVFIDVAKQKAEFLKTRNVHDVEAEFSTLRARLYHYSTKAILSFHVNALTGPAPTQDQLVELLRRDVAARKGAELIAVGGAKFTGADAAAVVEWAAKVEGPRPVGDRETPGVKESDVWLYRRIDIPRPRAQKTLLILFEVRKERWKKAEPGMSKVLRKMKLG